MQIQMLVYKLSPYDLEALSKHIVEEAECSDIIDNHDPEETPYSEFETDFNIGKVSIHCKCKAFFGLEKRYGGERYGVREDCSEYHLLSVSMEDMKSQYIDDTNASYTSTCCNADTDFRESLKRVIGLSA